MTGLVRKAAALAACGVFTAAVAFAGVPSPGNSTIPGRINLVGYGVASTLADSLAPGAKVQVTVRDLANNPIPNSSVVLDFSGCVSDTRIHNYDGVNPNYGFNLTSNCGTKGITALTDVNGVATFVVVGGGYAVAGAPHAAGALKFYADGVYLGPGGVGQYDQNGAAGVGGADLSRWLADFVGSPNADRSNFDGAGIPAVGGADLSLWLGVFVAGRSNTSSTTYCTP